MNSRTNSLLLAATMCLPVVSTGLASAHEKPATLLQSPSISLPDDDNTFPDGSSAGIANSYCTICHSAGMVTTQPQLDKKKWKKIVTKMRNDFGCPLPEENVDELVEYLNKINQLLIKVEVAAGSPAGAISLPIAPLILYPVSRRNHKTTTP